MDYLNICPATTAARAMQRWQVWKNMDTQMAHQHAHYHCYETDPQNVGVQQVGEGGHEDEHHEKKSVLKKVKAKAKKIKDSITGHSHDHDHDHDLDLDEEDDEDEELVEDPEVHGAPMYESGAMRSGAAMAERQVDKPGKVNDRFGRSTTGSEDSGVAPNSTQSVSPGVLSNGQRSSEPSRTFVSAEDQGQLKVNLGGPMGLVEDPQSPKEGRSKGYTSPSEHQMIKTNDPTGQGSKEAVGITPVLQSFGKMNITNEQEQQPEQQRDPNPTGSHDQFSPEPTDATKSTTSYPTNSSTYTNKISAVTSAIADKAISAKNAVAAKLGYGEIDQQSKDSTTATSEMHGTVAGSSGGVKGQDRGISTVKYLAEKLKPGEEDRALSEMISDALHKRKEEGKVECTSEEKPMGKVTESEEVKRRLGIEEEKKNDKGTEGETTNTNEIGKGMVNKLKDTVGSWWGRGGGGYSQTSQQSTGSQQGVEGSVDSAGEATQQSSTGGEERRLQESGN